MPITGAGFAWANTAAVAYCIAPSIIAKHSKCAGWTGKVDVCKRRRSGSVGEVNLRE